MDHRDFTPAFDGSPPLRELLCSAFEYATARSMFEKGRHAWLYDPPTPDCFADDSSTLAAFVDGALGNIEANEHSQHLLRCHRCSFAVGQVASPLIEESYSSNTVVSNNKLPCLAHPSLPQISPWTYWENQFKTWGALVNKLTAFPGGLIAQVSWQCGYLLDHIDWHSIVNQIAHEVIRVLRSNRIVFDLIVAHSDLMHRIAREIAAASQQEFKQHIPVVRAMGYFEPRLVCNANHEIPSRSVLLLLDIVYGGGLFERLASTIQRHKPAALNAFSLFCNCYTPKHDIRLIALIPEIREVINAPPENITACDFFDPDLGKSNHAYLPEQAYSDTVKAGHAIFSQLGDWYIYIKRTNAIRVNCKIGRAFYPVVVDVLRLLTDEECRARLLVRAKECLSRFNHTSDCLIIYPATRAARAGRLARFLAKHFGCSVAALGQPTTPDCLHISADTKEKLARCKAVIIVDAAIRSGATLRAQVETLRAFKVPAMAFYVLNALTEPRQSALESMLGVEIACAFRLPLTCPPTESIGSFFSKRFKHALKTINNVRDSQLSSAALEVVLNYCQRKTEPVIHHQRTTSISEDYLHEDVVGELGQQYAGELVDSYRIRLDCFVERLSSGRPVSLDSIKRLDVDKALQSTAIRSIFSGILYNTARTSLVEWCALALTSQQDYSWFERSWLLLHSDFFTLYSIRTWSFLAFVAYDLKRHCPSLAAEKRGEIMAFRKKELRKLRRLRQLDLFPSPKDQGPTEVSSLQARCDILLEILS